MTKLLRNESGYSLVEVLVAIIILTIAIIPMVSMFDAGLRSATTSGNYDKARALANEELESIKALGYNAAETAYPPAGASVSCDIPPTFDCEVDTTYVYVDVPAGSDTSEFQNSGASDPKDMMKVVVTVEWGASNEYTVTGLVGR